MGSGSWSNPLQSVTDMINAFRGSTRGTGTPPAGALSPDQFAALIASMSGGGGGGPTQLDYDRFGLDQSKFGLDQQIFADDIRRYDTSRGDALDKYNQDTRLDMYKYGQDRSDRTAQQQFDNGITTARLGMDKAKAEFDQAMAVGDFQLAQAKQADYNHWQGVSAELEGQRNQISAWSAQADYDARMAGIEQQRQASNNQYVANMANATNDQDRNRIAAAWNQEQAKIAQMEDETRRLLTEQQNQTAQFGAETDRAARMGQLALENNKFIQEMSTNARNLPSLFMMQRGLAPDWDTMTAGGEVARGTALAPADVMGAYKPVTKEVDFSKPLVNRFIDQVGQATGGVQIGNNPFIRELSGAATAPVQRNMGGLSIGAVGGTNYQGTSGSIAAPKVSDFGKIAVPGPVQFKDMGPVPIDINLGGRQGGVPLSQLRPGMNLSTVGGTNAITGADFERPAYYDQAKTRAIAAGDVINPGMQVWIDNGAAAGGTYSEPAIVGDSPDGRDHSREEVVTPTLDEQGRPAVHIQPINPEGIMAQNLQRFATGTGYGAMNYGNDTRTFSPMPTQSMTTAAPPVDAATGYGARPKMRQPSQGWGWGRDGGMRGGYGNRDSFMRDQFMRMAQRYGVQLPQGWGQAPQQPEPVMTTQGGGADDPRFAPGGEWNRNPTATKYVGWGQAPQQPPTLDRSAVEPPPFRHQGLSPISGGGVAFLNTGGMTPNPQPNTGIMYPGGSSTFNESIPAGDQIRKDMMYRWDGSNAPSNPSPVVNRDFTPENGYIGQVNQPSKIFDNNAYQQAMRLAEMGQGPMPLRRFAAGTYDNPQAQQAYNDQGMGGAWVGSSDNAWAYGQPGEMSQRLKALAGYGFPVSPSLYWGTTGMAGGNPNLGAAFTTGRQAGTLTSMQQLNRMTPQEQQLYRGYTEGVAGVPWQDTVDYMQRGTARLQGAARAGGM